MHILTELLFQDPQYRRTHQKGDPNSGKEEETFGMFQY